MVIFLWRSRGQGWRALRQQGQAVEEGLEPVPVPVKVPMRALPQHRACLRLLPLPGQALAA